MRRVTLLLLAVLLAAPTLRGCALKRGVDFAGIASQSSDTLGDVTSLEGRIMNAEMPAEQRDAALDRAGQIRATVLGLDLVLVMAVGETYDEPTSAKINALVKTTHRHVQSFVNRPAELFARSAVNANEWDAFDSKADALLSDLRGQINR